MSTHKAYRPNSIAVIVAGVFALSSLAVADELSEIKLPGDRAYPESIAAAPDGTLYVSSLASGGIWRIKPGTAKAEEWIKPGAFDTRSTFGVLVDPKANLLWVCSNDVSALGVPGPSSTKGSYVKGFDLASGEGKMSADLPGKATLCNDMAIGADGSLFVTNSLVPQIMRLKPGSTQLDIWLESPAFEQPAQGAGLDGIAFGGDGNIYVNTFTNGAFFRVDVKDGAPGKVTKLQTSRLLRFPDGLRPIGDQTFVMAEGAGSLDRVTVKGDAVEIETIEDGLDGPTSVALVGQILWAPEGQLPHLFDAAKNGPPHLPFRVVGVPGNQ
jgi:sugar lactone lactonase YvrE